MDKVQRLDGYGHESLFKLNDCLRYSLIPPEKVSLCSLMYPTLNRYILRIKEYLVSD